MYDSLVKKSYSPFISFSLLKITLHSKFNQKAEKDIRSLA